MVKTTGKSIFRTRAAMNAGIIANLTIQDLLADPQGNIDSIIACDIPVMDFPASDQVFPLKRNEPALLMVASGAVDILARSSTTSRFIKRIGPGTLFGEMRSVGMTMLGCRAAAATDCSVLVLEADVAHALRDRTAARWAELQGPMLFDCAWDRNRIKFAGTRVRLAALLLDLSDENGAINCVSQQSLAGHLGVYRESLSRPLMRLRREGLVQWTRQSMVVDRARLAQIVERDE